MVIDDRMIIAGLTEGQKVTLAKRLAWFMLFILLLAGGVFVVQSRL